MISKFLQELKMRGLSQVNIAKLTGLSAPQISKLSRGAMPSLETVLVLADKFKTSTDKVLGR